MKKRLRTLLPFLLAFIIPILGVILIWTLSYLVFGAKPKLFGDWQYQNIEFLLYSKSIYTGQNNLFYTFNIAGGANAYSIFFSYLTSPFNLIVLLFPAEQIVFASLIIILLKVGTAGLTFYIYIHKVFPNLRFNATIFFVLAWTLSSFIISYCWLTAWMDSIILLPIVCLGIKYIIQGKSPKIYFISLALSILLNYYTAWMLCLFSVLWFVYLLFIDMPEITKKEFLHRKKNIITFLLSSLFAGLINGVILLPIILDVFQTTNRVNMSGTFLSNPLYCFFSIIEQLTFGLYSTDGAHFIVGYPNIFIGTITLFFTTTYFFNKNINKKNKIVSLSLIFILILSLMVPNLNKIWHAGTATAWYPSRFAFVFSFVLINLATESFNTYQKNELAHFSIFFFIIYIFLIYDSNVGNLSLITRILIPTFTFCLFILSKKCRPCLKNTLFIILQLTELVINGSLLWTQENIDIAGQDELTVTEITEDIKKNLAIKKYITEQDSSTFFRIINSNTELYNWSLINNMYAVDGFASTLNFENIFFKSHLTSANGCSWSSTNNSDALPNEDSLFGVKYIVIDSDKQLKQKSEPLSEEMSKTADQTMSLKEISQYLMPQYEYIEKKYEKIYSNEDYSIYYNPQALSIGFQINEQYTSNLDTLIQNIDKAQSNNSFNLINSSTISGDIILENNNLIIFSIQNTPGWSAKIDNSPAEIIEIADGLIGIKAASGQHTVELSYTPQGLKIGIAVSGATIVIIITQYVYYSKKYKK